MAVRAEKPSQRDLLAPARRDQVVTAARKVIGEAGYEQASVDAIAREAELAKSTVYSYFDSKAEILAGCFAVGQEQLRERIAAEMGVARETRGRLVALATAVFRHVDESRAFLRAVASITLSDESDVAFGHLLDLDGDIGATIERVIHEGIAAGDVRKHTARDSAQALGTLIYGAVLLRAREARPEPAVGEAHRLVGCLFDGLRAQA